MSKATCQKYLYEKQSLVSCSSTVDHWKWDGVESNNKLEWSIIVVDQKTSTGKEKLIYAISLSVDFYFCGKVSGANVGHRFNLKRWKIVASSSSS